MKNNSLLTFLVLIIGLSWVTAAMADDINCPTDTIPDVVDGNVFVENGSCQLNGTTVNGNVTVGAGGTLIVTDGANVHGNIQSADARTVSIRDSSVGGDIQNNGPTVVVVTRSSVHGGVQSSSAGEVRVSFSNVGGDVQIIGSSVVLVARCSVHGDVQSTGARQVRVSDSTVWGNVQLKEMVGIENDLPSFVGATLAGVSLIKGNVQIEEFEELAEFNAGRGTILGNFQVYKNAGILRIFVTVNLTPSSQDRRGMA